VGRGPEVPNQILYAMNKKGPGGSFNFLKYSGPWEYDAKVGEFQNFKLQLSGNNCMYSHETYSKNYS
jgi:hypothetical protein